MIHRILLTFAAAMTLTMGLITTPVQADTVDAAHTALCMRLQQCASRSPAAGDSGQLRLQFQDHINDMCSLEGGLLARVKQDAETQEKARACFRSLTVMDCDTLEGMDMDTPACAAFHSHIGG